MARKPTAQAETEAATPPEPMTFTIRSGGTVYLDSSGNPIDHEGPQDPPPAQEVTQDSMVTDSKE